MSDRDEELINSSADKGNAVADSSAQGTKPRDSLPSLISEQEIDGERARHEEEWRSDLFRLENEMSTLRSVLASKIEEAEAIKKKLGITPLVEFKEDIKLGFQTFKESDPVQKTSAAFKDFGEFASKKLGNLRNSSAFKSVEGKVGGAYTSVKKRISSSKSEDNENAEIETAEIAEEVPALMTRSQEEYNPLQP